MLSFFSYAEEEAKDEIDDILHQEFRVENGSIVSFEQIKDRLRVVMMVSHKHLMKSQTS